MIDQGRIDAFADATGDHQWIHVDPERAASGPFGTTVAHGYLTLSLVPVLVSSLLDYAGWPVKINYGSNKVRFPMPVPVDSAVRAGVEVDAVREVPAGLQVALKVTVEIRNPSGEVAGKPALVAETLTLLAAIGQSSRQDLARYSTLSRTSVRSGRVGADVVRPDERVLCAGEPVGVVGEQGHQHLTLLHRVARLGVQDDAGTGLDRVLLARPSGTEPPGRDADRQRVEAGQDAGRGGLDLLAAPSPSAARRRGHRPGRRSSPATTSIAEPSRQLVGRVDAVMARGGEHLSCQGEGQLDDVLRSPACQHVERLLDLDRVAGRETERRAHVGDERDGLQTRVGADRDHGRVPAPRRRRRSFMNAPEPTFTSRTRAPVPSAIFLLMIELAMSGIASTVPVTSRSAYSFLSAGARAEPGGADDRADILELAHHLVVRQVRPPAGDRLELVERAAGVPEPAPGQLRHRDTARRDQRARAEA